MIVWLLGRWRWLHLLIRWWQLGGAWRNHQGHRHLQVVGFDLIAATEGRMGLGHAHGIQLGAMPFDPTADGFGDQVFDLLAADLHIREPLPGQQQLGCQSVCFLFPTLREAAAALAMTEYRVGDFNSLLGAHQLVGGEGDCKSVQ